MHEPDVAHNLLVDLGYEVKDVRLKPLISALCSLILLILVSCLFCLYFYLWTSPKYPTEANAPKWITERRLPPNPQVQAYPKDEITLFYKAQDPATSVLEKAKADAAAEGIAGMTGGATPEVFKSDFPGSGKFAGAAEGTTGH